MRTILSVLVALVALAPRAAEATRCPTVMIVLDSSGSMGDDPTGGFSTPTKMDIAKMALDKLMMELGDQIPFGFTTFTSDTEVCTQGVNVVVSPMDGTTAQIISAIAAAQPDGGTNTGPAIDAVAALPAMNDSTRPGSYILLVTDGEPNCPGNVGTETSDPAYTVGAIARASMKGIKTFVVGFGALPSADQMAMNMMAAAGGEVCTGSTCNGQMYYAAEDDAGLQAAINSISNTIVGEFGGVCDDSCYADGCPSAGQICVQGQCVDSPCNGIDQNCAPGSYCYTDGTSSGSCTASCSKACAAGQICTRTGCAPDPCATMSCPSGTCKSGFCITNDCMPGCKPGQDCVNGTCKDDPCQYVTCPNGGVCTPLLGACGPTGEGTGGNDRRGGGCEVGGGGPLSLSALLLVGLFAARRRRRYLLQR